MTNALVRSSAVTASQASGGPGRRTVTSPFVLSFVTGPIRPIGTDTTLGTVGIRPSRSAAGGPA